MSRWFLIATLTCLSICSTLEGQRIFATVDPTALEENLKFDTNDIALVRTGLAAPVDLNFSPNVVFSLDSSKAFVSYPGSNKVLVFDPMAGTPLQPTPLIEVGDNPALMTLTPDGNTLAVVCLFLADNLPQSGEIFVGKQIGTIALIDVATLAVRRIDLTEVFFSFANNIVFSGDSKTGFVASSGTDEILRFDVDSATEITPRLKMTAGTRPSSITMTPDFSSFVAVLVGSNLLPQEEVPDSLQIIDVDSFTVTRSIVPAIVDQGFPPPHDFFASNTLAISPDGQFGLIADQELSSLGLLLDHALLINLQTGDTVQQFDIGRRSGPSFPVPGGKRFVTISADEIEIIDIEALSSLRVTPPLFLSGFRATTRPAFFKDGTGMFVASAIRDFLLEVDLNTGTLRRSVDLGPDVDVEEDGVVIRTIPAAPLDLAWSPDRLVLSAVKFNANTVALLRETQRIFIPRLLSDDEFFTGIALANNSSQEATLIAKGVGPSGSELRNDPDTDAAGDFRSPQTITLGAGQQTSFTIRELMEANPQANVDAWLDIASDQFEMAGFFLVGDLQLKRLDGGLVTFDSSAELVLPEVRVSNGFRTEVTVLNPNLNQIDVEMSLINSAGEVVEEILFMLGGNFVLRAFVRDPDPADDTINGLFQDTSLEDFVSGYLRLSSEAEVIAFERYFDDQQFGALNGIPVGSDVQLPTELYLPQVVAFANSETFVNLIHTGTASASVTLSLKGNQGQDLAAPVNLALEPAESIKRNLVDLFNLVDPGSALSGWVLIQTDVPGIVGDAEVHSVSGQTMTNIPIQGSPMGSFVFSHVAQGLDISTSLVLLNPGPATAMVQIDVHTSDGTLLDSLTLSIAPSNREVRFLKDLFPTLPDLLGGYIKVTSDQNIIGVEFFHADNLDFLVAVAAQPIQPTLGPGQRSSFATSQLVEATPKSTLDDGLLSVSNSNELSSPEVQVSSGFTPESTDLNLNLDSTDEGQVVAFEPSFEDQQLAALDPTPIGSDVKLPSKLYLLQVRTFAGSETLLNLSHTGVGSANVTLSLKGNRGEDLAAPFSLEMESGQSIRRNLTELFNLVDAGSAVSGWVLIETDVPEIVGEAELHAPTGQTATSIPIQSSPLGSFDFSHEVQGLDPSMTLVLLNPGVVTATVQIELYSPEGASLDSLSLSIAPSHRESRPLKELFPELPDLSGGSIQVSSEQEIIGLGLFHLDSMDSPVAVGARPIDPVF